MSEIIDIVEEANLNELLASDLPVLVDFWAPWCAPCKSMLPIIETVAKQFAGKLAFAKIDIDQLPSTASKYKVGGIPYLLLLKKGVPVADLTGLQPHGALQDFLVENLKSK